MAEKVIPGVIIECRIIQASLVPAILLVWLFFAALPVSARDAELQGIYPGGSSAGIRLQMSQKIPGKVIMVDDREVLIALKNIRKAGGMENGIRSNDIIRSIEIEELPGNVLAIVVSGRSPFKSVGHNWDKDGRNLTVNFYTAEIREKNRKNEKPVQPRPSKAAVNSNKGGKKRVESPPESSIQKDRQKTVEVSKDQTAEVKTESSDTKKSSSSIIDDTSSQKATPVKKADTGKKKVYGTRNKKLSDIAGDISDMVGKADLSGCSSADLKKAYMLLQQSSWSNAFELLNGYLEKGGKECVENADFLKALAFYKSVGDEDPQQLLQAQTMFHNLLVNWPDSPFVPFALSALGLISYEMQNSASAEGYFSIVRDNYKTYTGIPEVLYYLAMIYDEKGNNDREFTDRAIENYREVFDNHSESVYAVDAGVGLGKDMFRKLSYIESRDILTSLVESNPEIIYDSPEVLRSIGEAEYALQRSEAARDSLAKVYNLFPDISDKDMVMTKIGDTYFYEKNLDRARVIYQFVMDKFPGTEGFLGSAMGLALCLKEKDKIIEIYNMVKKDFADHRLSKVAMMRLAELYNKNGEYEKCIEEIENLLATHPAGLRYDAVRLMQSAYEALFRKKLKSGEYPDVLKTYEGAKVLLDRLESREIFLSTGLSYLKANIYEQAFNQLMESYKQYKQDERPPELLFGLGVAMDETGRKDDALNILRSYAERKEALPDRVEAYVRIGNILFDKGELTRASKSFRSAFDISKDRIVRGNILSHDAEVYQRLNDWKSSSEILEKAVAEYASATGKNYELISGAYKELGKSYLEQKSFVKAAEAFSMALKISDSAGFSSMDIVFMLGDAYQKANAIDKAKEAFQKVAGSEDSIWARLAKERLSTIELSEKVSSS